MADCYLANFQLCDKGSLVGHALCREHNNEAVHDLYAKYGRKCPHMMSAPNFVFGHN